jgi:predicted secreted protein
MALASSAAVALVIIWVLAALVLPLLVRGRHLAVDIVLASSWAAGMASATQALGRALPGGPRHPTSSVLVIGAVAAGVFALVGARRPPPVEQESRSMARPYEEHS